MGKKRLIATILFILIISLFNVFAEEALDEESVLVPIEEVASDELLDDKVESIPAEVDETVEELPEEELEIELISVPEEEEDLPVNEVEVIEEVVEELPEEEIEVEPRPSLFARGKSLAGAGIRKARGVAGWFITRDYVSVAKNKVKYLLGLSIWVKLLLIFFALIFVLVAWSYFFKDTRANNLRRARRLHRRGERAHNNNNEERAELCYARAAEYREKAQDQW